jgi:cysteine desulfurase
MLPIYLDYNSTTPIDPQVRAAMLPYFAEGFGNPSNTHAYGVHAHAAVESAREEIANTIGAEPDEIVFTGGGSEASNYALKGVVFQNPQGWQTTHLITAAAEHPATLQPCLFLQQLGCPVTILPVDRFGMVNPDDVRQAITPQTKLISIMHSNNEVGTINPIAAISRIAHERGILLHTDVAQSLGKLPIDVNALGVDLMTIAGHKLYAPKGIGVLYIRRGVTLSSLIHGAGHEQGRRAGTENVPAIVGLGKAARLAGSSLPNATRHLRTLRDRLHHQLLTHLEGKLVLNGHPDERLPNTLNVNFVGHIGAELLAALPGLAASTGAACHAGSVTLSPVLTALGIPPEIACGAVRLTVGRFTTMEEIEQAAAMLIAAAQ